MFIASVGGSGAEVGKLWVDYDVELYVPQNSPDSDSSPSSISYASKASGSQSVTTNTTTDILFDQFEFDPLGLGSFSSGVLTLPAGNYKVTYMGNYSSDSGASALLSSTRLEKDGAAMDPDVLAVMEVASTATPTLYACLIGVVSSDGSNTLGVTVTITGSGNILVTEPRLLIEVA
jgi:hypothetical protein